ncbi:unnamed protein product [Pedinophyceae sp. YPF-701]|nr:unnamed protein product [Pedinophyceae sp. YPF-701]
MSSKQGRPAARHVAARSGDGEGEKPRVGLLGVGLMGNKMARRLREQGFDVWVWNRNAEKAAPLAEAGCTVCATPAEAIWETDVIVLTMADAGAIKEVLVDDDATRQTLAMRTVLQMGTIGPAESRELKKDIELAGAEYIEAPVLGSQPEASKGTLLVMVGCDREPSETRAWPVIEALGSNIQHMGEVGAGAATKLAMNQLIGALTTGFATSLGLLTKNGVDASSDSKFMTLLRDSALYAPTYDKKLDRMLQRDYSGPNFPTRHLLKDIRLFILEAEKAGLDTSLLLGQEAVIADTCERGLDDTDYSAVYDGVIEPGVAAGKFAKMKANVELLPPADGVKRIEITGGVDWRIEAQPGKMASIAIYNALAQLYGGKLDLKSAAMALTWYAEAVEDAKKNPGSHPNVDLLFKVIEGNLEATVTAHAD